MNSKHKTALAATMAALLGVAGTAHAQFQGRDATGAASSTCTATGPNKCTYFYDTTLDITILNNWRLGDGASWSAGSAPDSAQAVAASAGLAASGLTGWVLPTGDGGAPAGALNQYLSMWNSVGATFNGLANQFHLVQPGFYWSGSIFFPNPFAAWAFNGGNGDQINNSHISPLFAVAVRPGDIAAVPEPQTYALMLMGVGALLLAKRRQRL
jgi:hypothetical protein